MTVKVCEPNQTIILDKVITCPMRDINLVSSYKKSMLGYFRTLQEKGLTGLTSMKVEDVLCTTSLCASE